MKSALLPTLVCAALLVACNQNDAGKAAASATPSDTVAAPSASLEPSAAASVAEPTSAPPPKPVIPTIPTERSKPPTKPEWDAAQKINTAPEAEQHASCWMKLVREWVRVECAGPENASLAWSEEFGAKNSNWFLPTDAGAMILIVRMRPGFDQRARIDHLARRNGSYLHLNWSDAAGQPTEISLSSKPPEGDGIRALPQFPTERSKPPNVKEWQAAHEVNTAELSQRRDECSVKVVREWVKFNCGMSIDDFELPESLGSENSDWFMSKANGLDLVFRFKPGVKLNLPTNSGALHAEWPADAPQPKELSLGFFQG